MDSPNEVHFEAFNYFKALPLLVDAKKPRYDWCTVQTFIVQIHCEPKRSCQLMEKELDVWRAWRGKTADQSLYTRIYRRIFGGCAIVPNDQHGADDQS